MGGTNVVVGTREDSYARGLSGVDGSIIHEQSNASTGSTGVTFGRGVCALGDIDGDGLGECAVGEPTACVLRQARVYSSATGDEVYVLTWINQNHSFAWVMSRVGGLNGDGLDEFGIGATGFDSASFSNTGRVGLHSPQAPIGTNYCGLAQVGSSGSPVTTQAYARP